MNITKKTLAMNTAELFLVLVVGLYVREVSAQDYVLNGVERVDLTVGGHKTAKKKAVAHVRFDKLVVGGCQPIMANKFQTAEKQLDPIFAAIRGYYGYPMNESRINKYTADSQVSLVKSPQHGSIEIINNKKDFLYIPADGFYSYDQVDFSVALPKNRNIYVIIPLSIDGGDRPRNCKVLYPTNSNFRRAVSSLKRNRSVIE